jgi:tRNA(His) 5'-end guanylyltransferase
MKFDDLENGMRMFETSHDHCVLPGMHMVARLDGRSFTRLTRERHPFEAPYDVRFRDYMVGTARHLMDCGFRVLYAHTHSDEISLLIHPTEQAFGRRLSKYHSILAGEASAKFSLLLGDLASFDCRISQLPTVDTVADYFRWRTGEALRNALHSYCYWTLRAEGTGPQAADSILKGMSFPEKTGMLERRGIDFDGLPAWQKRGVGLYWEVYEKPGWDPRTGEHVRTTRRRIRVDMALPVQEAYSAFITGLLYDSTGLGASNMEAG